MDDAIDRYRRATEANDMEALAATLSPQVELVSPLSGRMVFRGADDVMLLATQVYGSTRGLRWSEQFGEGDRRVVVSRGRIGPFRLDDAMAFELGADGRIVRLRPHLRPWLATTYFALVLGPKLARHAGVLARALRG
jgi:SnoaL-like domain